MCILLSQALKTEKSSVIIMEFKSHKDLLLEEVIGPNQIFFKNLVRIGEGL